MNMLGIRLTPFSCILHFFHFFHFTTQFFGCFIFTPMLSCCNSSFPLSPNPLGSSSSVVFSCPPGMTHAMGPLRRKNCSAQGAQDKSSSSVSYPGPRASPAPHSALLPLDEQTQNSNQAWTIRRHISNLKTNAVHTYLFSLVLNTLKRKLSD